MQNVGLQQYVAVGGDTSSATRSDMGSKDVFLKLLTAQMQHQDPLKPQDPTQMSSQLAQFNMVEQQISTNDLLAQLAQSLSANGKSTNTDTGMYLGHTVVAESSQINFDASVGTVTANIHALSPAVNAKVIIRDASGGQVRELDIGVLQAGKNTFNWDGVSDAGTPVASGRYSMEVVAADAQGNPVETATSVTGKITAVQMDGLGNSILLMGELPIAYDAIREIQI
ncbi:MAG: flagellar hook assembly protein FlgD [Mariprofundaceae bacterium]